MKTTLMCSSVKVNYYIQTECLIVIKCELFILNTCFSPKVYQFKYPKVPKPSSLRIYECHVGIATSEYKVGSYQEFKDKMLDRIVDLGEYYTTVLSTVSSRRGRYWAGEKCLQHPRVQI